MPSLRRVGADAEDRAADFLLGLGYTIVTRRYKAAHGEIDIVALDGSTLVFIEVKLTRTHGAVPEAAVDERKVRRLASAADEYLHKAGEPDRPIRYDIVAIDSRGLRHHIDAFRPG